MCRLVTKRPESLEDTETAICMVRLLLEASWQCFCAICRIDGLPNAELFVKYLLSVQGIVCCLSLKSRHGDGLLTKLLVSLSCCSILAVP